MSKRVVYIVGAALSLSVIAGGVFTLTNDKTPSSSGHIKSSISNTQQKQDAQTITQPATQPESVGTTQAGALGGPDTPTYTPDQTKAEVDQDIVSFVTSHSSVSATSDIVNIQINCIDKLLSTNGIGYTDHDATLAFVNSYYLTGTKDNSGSLVRHYFQNASCSVLTVPAN